MENTKKPTNSAETANLNFVCMCVSYGCQVEQVNKDNPKRVTFILSGILRNVLLAIGDEFKLEASLTFEESEKLFATQNIYLPPNFPEVTRRMKSLIYE